MRRRRGFIMVKHHPHGGHSGNSRGIFSRMLNKLSFSAGSEFEPLERQRDTRRAPRRKIRQRCFLAQTDGETDFVSGPRLEVVCGAALIIFGIMNGVFGIELAAMSKESMLGQIAYFATAWGITSQQLLEFISLALGVDFSDPTKPNGPTWTSFLNLHPNKIAWAAHMEKKIPNAPARLKQLLTDQWENGFKQSQPVWGLHRLDGVGRLEI